MSLADVVAAAGLACWAEAALVIFVAVFAAVLVHTFAPGQRAAWERARRMPLDEACNQGGRHA